MLQSTDSTRKPVVFLGPSMPLAEAQAVLPNADYRPPIRRGDLEKVDDGATVAIIDGVFDSILAISPREIRNAIRRGIIVLGSSSMGALRAAEVEGVLGVGRVFGMYRSGVIDRDDEVALLFDPDTGAALTQPLVNLRCALQSLLKAGTLDKQVAAVILDAGLALHYRDRTYRNILQQAGLSNSPDADLLIQMFASFDIKKEDAQLLLETLASDPRPSHPPAEAIAKTPMEVDLHDSLEQVEPEASSAADAALVVWEFGDVIGFRELVAFLKLTNVFRRYAKNATDRYVLSGKLLDLEEPSRGQFANDQELLTALSDEWGWETSEEATVSLVDMGVGVVDLVERLEEEAKARKRLASVAQSASDEFDRALRMELLINDLSLKREALRLGALRSLSALGRTGGPPSPDELEAAKRSLCRVHQCLRWSEVVAELECVGIDESELDSFATILAHARRGSVPLLQALAANYPPPRSADRGLPLRSSPKAPNSLRFCLPMDRADALANDIAGAIGVTRIAMVGELGDLGVYISKAFRHSTWSATAGSGKSESREGARVGAVMEEAEKFAQDEYNKQATAEVTASYAELRCNQAVVDPESLGLPFDSRYSDEVQLQWTRCLDLMSGERLFVPLAAVSSQRLNNDIYYSPRLGKKIFYTNGLASGFTLEEAVLHATAELIERHATRLAAIQIENPGVEGGLFKFIDLNSVPESTKRLLNQFQRAGLETRILDITCEFDVPTFEARMFPDFYRADGTVSGGAGTHPDSEVAINMALLEAAQTRVGNIAGSREDLNVKVRSLGRHERTRPIRPAASMFWYGNDRPTKRFDSVTTLCARDVLQEVEWTLDKLHRGGVERVLLADYSVAKIAPAFAVRVLIPGIETLNPLHTGTRARALAIRDLLPAFP